MLQFAMFPNDYMLRAENRYTEAIWNILKETLVIMMNKHVPSIRVVTHTRAIWFKLSKHSVKILN